MLSVTFAIKDNCYRDIGYLRQMLSETEAIFLVKSIVLTFPSNVFALILVENLSDIVQLHFVTFKSTYLLKKQIENITFSKILKVWQTS